MLVGFEGFPLTSLDVNVVGYAVKDKSLLQGDTTGLDIYTTADGDGVPECDTRCYRGGHLGVGDNISQCPGGEDSRYDISLWLDDSLLGQMGGYGYNWGEELPPDYFFDTVDNENVHILLHEMGHGFGLLGRWFFFLFPLNFASGRLFTDMLCMLQISTIGFLRVRLVLS